jgi:signal transduction histidine kinase/DNA-binding response OmpR family regulator/ligand-binding sensor domain-containing protein
MKKQIVTLFSLLLLINIHTIKGNNSGYYYFKQISVKEGLPSTVTSIYDDQNGLVWIGTPYGIYRFDGEKLKKYPQHHSTHTYSQLIYGVTGNGHGNVWIFTQNGTMHYNQKKDLFEPLLNEGRPIKAYTAFTDKNQTIFPIRDTLLYYHSDNRPLERLPLKKNGKPVLISKMYTYDEQTFIALSTTEQRLILINKFTGEIKNSPFDSLNMITDFYIDSQNRFWITEYGKGAACYTPEGKLTAIFNSQNPGLSSNVVLDIEERNGQIWLATDGGGVNIITPESRQLTILSSERSHNFPANSVLCLQNSKNNMWIGMVREGLLGMKENFIKTYTKAPKNDPSGMSEKCPLCLLEDEKGTIWIGTDGGGINCFNPNTEEFTHFPSTFGDKIVSICRFSDTELLASNFNKGIYIFDKKNGKKRHFTILNEQIDSRINYLGIPVNLYTTPEREIEFHGGYYYRYSREKKQFTSITPPGKNYLGAWIFIGEYDSKPYFFTQTHIFLYNKEANRYEPTSINLNQNILSAYIDSTGVVWMATRNGLNTLNLKTSEKTEIKLPDDNDIVTSLIMDHTGIMWIGTSGTLYAYFPKEKRFVIFSETDGVSPNDFLPKPVLVTRDNNIYMGGSSGLVRVNKSLNQHYEQNIPKLSLLETQLNGINIMPDHSGNVPQLEINPHFTSLTVRSKLDEGDIFRKRIYRYHIEGLNSNFIQSSRPYLAIQTLPPGDYRIKVQCTQIDGRWSPFYDLLHLTVLPPWWQHPVFITLYISILLVVAIYIIRRREERMQQKLKEKERQIYKDKVQALININHELRTPLTLLYTPLKQLMNNKQIPYEIRGKLQGTFKQARQMKNIINMILNMRKMEVGQNTMQLTPTLFNDWIQTIIDDFGNEFEMRGIRLVFHPDPNIRIVSFDIAQCEIIVSNLLMNAYKFSYPNSEVMVTTRLEQDNKLVRIEVKDEGIGLGDENIESLFTRFQQGKHNIQGTGIGLSYAKQLVEMHGGSIGAVNNETKGATFYFTLPYQQVLGHVTCTPKPYLNEVLPIQNSSMIETCLSSTRYCSVIIVEDDPDLCDYLAENLSSLFETVYKAHDGMEAIPTIVSKFPQLVISDIIMPRMNGLELCKRIKENAELGYIPVILLTSRVDDPSMEQSYKTGADAYIPKPFDMDLLTIQIQNILNNHNIMRQHYRSTEIMENEHKSEPETPQDEQFIILLNKIISENMDNTELDVNMVAQLMYMSRATLYNKMKTFIGVGVNEYITQQRIRHAQQLLTDTALGIRDISEQTGFTYQRNFSTIFKNTVGESPSEYRKKNKEE